MIDGHDGSGSGAGARSRRVFLKASGVASAAAVTGTTHARAAPGAGAPAAAAARPAAPAAAARPASTAARDPYAMAARFGTFVRVTDVTDGLDALGRADKCLLDPTIRPLWMGMRFWGPAVTMRVLPTTRNMPVLERKDALRQHAIWDQMIGRHTGLKDHIKTGCVIVTSTGGARECGYWGSNNALDMQSRGVAGIVTDGHCRDTDEVIMQKNPVACRGIGRTIIPGRVELVDVQVPVSCGGVMIRPGDIVGCDWDGVVVVPIEIAEDALAIAARIAVDDKKKRRQLYEKLGRRPDETVDWEAAARFYKDLL
jgi:regulator of RNase E activity RraA